MPGRKLQALTLIGKIIQQSLEQEAAALGRLRRRIAELEAEKAALFADLQQAQPETRGIEASLFLPSFLHAMRAAEARIVAELDRLEEEATAIEAALLERFRERKTFDKVRADAQAAEDAERNRAEAAILDELSVLRHRAAATPG
jgi:flagellar export protein FliJ